MTLPSRTEGDLARDWRHRVKERRSVGDEPQDDPLAAPTAKVRRSELHTKGENRGRLRVHDLRGPFVTLALANGNSEAWVQDRTGHTSSTMLNRYRRAARSAGELGLGLLVPLNTATPELAGELITHALPTATRPAVQSDDMLVDGSSLISAVPKVGLEPTRLFRTTDFESAASASSATSACREVSCS